MTHPFVTRLARSWDPQAWCDTTLVVALSGGVDSVALLRGLLAARAPGPGRIVAAHFHHGQRGADADADQQFCLDLCRELQVDCHTQRASSAATVARSPDGLEAALRAARYEFLQSCSQRLGARYVVTAHTADDQIETALHRIVRGTGLGGLAGIPRVRELTGGVTLMRPLLATTRREALDFLQTLGQPFREDRTNRDLRFTRNRIRHELLPLLAAQYNPRVGEAVLRLASLANEAQQVIRGLARKTLDECWIRGTATLVELNCRPLAEVAPLIAREMLIVAWQQRGWPQQEMGYDEWEQLATLALATGAQPPLELPGGVTATRQGVILRLARPHVADPT